MKKVPTLSIGIPAYNEAANIKHLLRLLLSQKEGNFHFETIYIISDGSSDNTLKEVHAIKDKRIYAKDDRKRLGKSARLEEILRHNTSDVLILMDADITFKDTYLLSKLINRVNFKKAGIAAINAQSLPPRTFFERTLDAGVYVTKRISEQWNNGNNYLSFKGCFLALSKDFAQKVHMPAKLVNNDAYLYFAAKNQGFTPVYVRDCVVYYRSPEPLSDHMKQSARYQYSQNELNAYFNDIQPEYKLPRAILLKSMWQTLLKKHVFFLAYLYTYAMTRMKKNSPVKSTWSIAGSTKQKIALSN